MLGPESIATWILAGLAFGIAFFQLIASTKFLRSRDQGTARKLLRTSLVFLPAIFLLVVVRWGLF